MFTVRDLYLVNSKYLILKDQRIDFSDVVINEPIIEVKKFPKFEIDQYGSEIIIINLTNKMNENLLLIIQLIDNRYVVLLPDEIDYQKEYSINNIWAFNFGGKLDPLTDAKKNELGQLFAKYTNKIIDFDFISQLLNISIKLPDDRSIIELILNHLSSFDLRNLRILSLDNKNKVENYIIDAVEKQKETIKEVTDGTL
jgi:hypothetical protein